MADEQLAGGLLRREHQRDIDDRRVRWIGRLDGSFTRALLEDAGDHGRQPLRHGCAQLFSHDGVRVGQPDLDHLKHEVAALRLPARDRGEEVLQLGRRRALRVREDRLHVFERGVGHRVDDRGQERLLRIEVVVERALRGAQLIEQVLDAERVIALGDDQPLRRFDERVTPHGAGCVIDGASHVTTCSTTAVGVGAQSRPIRRPTVGLIIPPVESRRAAARWRPTGCKAWRGCRSGEVPLDFSHHARKPRGTGQLPSDSHPTGTTERNRPTSPQSPTPRSLARG